MKVRSRRYAPLAAAVAAALAAPGMAAAAPSLQITDAGPSVPGLSGADEVASQLLGPGVTLAGPASINGTTTAGSYASALPSFGRFTDGTADLGIADGLVIGANARASSFATAGTDDQIATDRDDNDLYGVVNAAGLCGGNAAACINNATSVEFSVQPTARYLKFEYALAITESGAYVGGAWIGAVFSFPDGFALFVGGRQVADNCAVVPRTSTYVTMQTAGVVAPASSGNNRALAQANLDARIADPGAPAGFAYSTQDMAWGVRFATVPLTCVADVQAAFQAGTPVDLKIVVADANDSAVPPAVFLKGGSVRFSGNDDPSPVVDAPAPPAPPAQPSPATPAKPAPPAPAAPAEPGNLVTPLAPAEVQRPAEARGDVRVVQRVQLDGVGRYTFIYVNRETGKRLTLRPGSTVGRRALPKRFTAPVIRNTAPGTRIVLGSRFLHRAFPKAAGDVVLRVVLRSPDGTLSEVRMGPDGAIG
jgi:hypothetical protein